MASMPPNLERIRAKLTTKLAEKDFYEAHQLCRTLYYRMTAKKQFVPLYELLCDASILLFNAEQLTSGADLACLAMECLYKGVISSDPETMKRIGALFHHFCIHEQVDSVPRKAGQNNMEETNGVAGDAQTSRPAVLLDLDRKKFVQLAVRWSKTQPDGGEYGQPALHTVFARELFSNKLCQDARYHYTLSDDGRGCAECIIGFADQTGATQEDTDRQMSIAVLQLLCRRAQGAARAAMECYMRVRPGRDATLSLCHSVLDVISAHEGDVARYTSVVERYESLFSLDDRIPLYLDRIGQLYFNLPAPAAKPDLFRSLFSSMLGDEETDNEAPPVSNGTNALPGHGGHSHAHNCVVPAQNMQVDDEMD